MDAKRLNQLMKEQYPYISYDANLAEEYVKVGAPKLKSEDVIVWCFADYLMSQDLCEIEDCDAV